MISKVMTLSQHAQYSDLESEAAEWNSTIIDFIIYTCAFSNVSKHIWWRKPISEAACPKLSGYLLPPVTISTPAPDSLINPSAHVPCSYTSLSKLHQAFLSYYLASLVFLTHACPFSFFVCLSVPFWTCLRPVADLCLISWQSNPGVRLLSHHSVLYMIVQETYFWKCTISLQ